MQKIFKRGDTVICDVPEDKFSYFYIPRNTKLIVSRVEFYIFDKKTKLAGVYFKSNEYPYAYSPSRFRLIKTRIKTRIKLHRYLRNNEI